MKKVLILGAGLSGLCAARELRRAGHQVVVVDKGRGVGGRMATRRFEGGNFDHGAQFFTARTDEFRSLLQEWEQRDVAGEWFRGYPSPSNEKPDDHYPRFSGQTGMAGIAKFLAQDLDIHLNQEVERLTFANGSWQALATSGEVFSGEELLLTAPVPQSLALLDTADFSLPSEVRDTLESLRYEPCFAVLAQLAGPSDIPPPGALYLNGGIISWVADNFQKGISAREGSVTIHSTGSWAGQNFEADESTVIAALLQEASPLLGSDVVASQVRRWRYSKPENPLDIGSLRISNLQLTLAGDIFQGAKVEGAALSGLHAARSISAA